MRVADEPGAARTRGSVGLAVYWTVHALVAWTALLWYLWYRVPVHAALFEDAGAALPPVTRIVIAAASWVVRLLPFLVVLALPAAVVIGCAALVLVVLMAAGKVRAHGVARVVTPLVLALAVVGTLADVFAVWAMHVVVAQVAQAPVEAPPP